MVDRRAVAEKNMRRADTDVFHFLKNIVGPSAVRPESSDRLRRLSSTPHPRRHPSGSYPSGKRPIESGLVGRVAEALLITLLSKALDCLVELLQSRVVSENQQEKDGSADLESGFGPIEAIVDLAWHLDRAVTLQERQTIAERIISHAQYITSLGTQES